MSRSALVALALAVLTTGALAGPITVDGDLGDWGVTVADGNASNINTYAGVTGFSNLAWMSEDQNDNSNGYYVGPNYGGQDYDAEFLAVGIAGGNLYIAISTGQRPDNGFSYFAPGDIRITAGGVVYGIEVGGGQGGVAVAGMLVEYGDGATYSLNSGGWTIGLDAHSMPDLQTAGSLWSDAGWILDPIAPAGPTQLDHQFVGGTYLGHADYVYTLNDRGSQHAVIELSVPLALFGGADQFQVRWSPSCGNDELEVQLEHMPEPGTSVLLVLGGLTLGGVLIRRRRNSN